MYGTKNLRVVDLSVVPLHMAAHPQGLCVYVFDNGAGLTCVVPASVYAIAEQGIFYVPMGRVCCLRGLFSCGYYQGRAVRPSCIEALLRTSSLAGLRVRVGILARSMRPVDRETELDDYGLYFIVNRLLFDPVDGSWSGCSQFLNDTPLQKSTQGLGMLSPTVSE